MSKKFLTQILLPRDPTAALEAATKQYVDTHVAAAVQAAYEAGVQAGRAATQPTDDES